MYALRTTLYFYLLNGKLKYNTSSVHELQWCTRWCYSVNLGSSEQYILCAHFDGKVETRYTLMQSFSEKSEAL